VTKPRTCVIMMLTEVMDLEMVPLCTVRLKKCCVPTVRGTKCGVQVALVHIMMRTKLAAQKNVVSTVYFLIRCTLLLHAFHLNPHHELIIGNDVIYEVAAFMYVILSKAEKHVPYEELIGTTEYLTL
jgi:hypothetical protein